MRPRVFLPTRPRAPTLDTAASVDTRPIAAPEAPAATTSLRGKPKPGNLFQDDGPLFGGLTPAAGIVKGRA